MNFKFSAICLQETWLTDNDDLCLFSLPGYECISQGKHCSGKGGLVIYVDTTYTSKVKLNINMHESWEGLIVHITGGGLTKTVTLGNIYRPPRSRNDDLNSFTNEFALIISSLENNNSHFIFAGDFNINLLKLSENDTYSSFFDTLISHCLYPMITLPTRFTRTNGTLIDNFFCKLDNQYGFRPKHSTEHAALELIDRITNKMDTNEIPLNIFLDLDTIDHSILLNKLKYYGLKGSTLNLFQSYLSNRKQYTEIEDTTSTILPIQVGVPQGSILGPILFIIYVNDLPQCSNKFDFIMYADDTTLSSTIDSFSDINSNASADSLINAEIGKVIEWLKINKLSLNKNKSKYMTFHMPKKQIQHLTLKIDGINIEKVEEFNFLGLTMDTNLKWKKHTDKISNKCSKITGVLNRLKLLFPQEIKCLLYNSLIVPHINYCITAWGFHRNRITIIQKKAIRIITASSYISHTEPLFKQLNLLKVEDILTLQELKFYFKYNLGILSKYLQNWNFIPNSKIHNHNTRKITTLHTFKTKHEFAKKNT